MKWWDPTNKALNDLAKRENVNIEYNPRTAKTLVRKVGDTKWLTKKQMYNKIYGKKYRKEKKDNG